MKRDLKALIQEMALEEKAGMCSGLDFWHLKGVERLGIPSVMVSDGPHGLRKQDENADHLGINESIKAVCFPAGCLTACSFDRDLLKKLGDAIGKEAQATDLSVVLGPAVNIKRSPLCGRNFEYYSEDPYLAGETAAAFIEGVQEHHVGTSIKHFAANSQEFNRMSASSNVDERTLREIYLPAFETAVKKAQPYTVMCSYNRLNGTFASEHPWLLTDVLRKEWGFEGYVMSDWGAVNERVAGLKAGLELEMPSSGGSTDIEIVKAVQDGTLDEAVLDQAVERILNIVFEYVDHREEQEFTLEADHELARHIAGESMVLLKNEAAAPGRSSRSENESTAPCHSSQSENESAGDESVPHPEKPAILPLAKDEKVAFIGEFAAKPRFQGGGSSHINCFRVSSVLDEVKDNTNITYAKGFAADRDVYDEALAAEAVEAARAADKAVLFVGLPDSFESEGYDRSHMRLPDCQNRLIEEILKVQENVIVVLHNGSPVELPWADQVKGILEAYLGGQAAGGAIADILFGKVNPSGKLAETFPLRLEDNPSYLAFGDPIEVNYNEGIYVGYRYYDAKHMAVAYPFGYGLSYTTFSYSNLNLSQASMSENEKITVSVDITNTGDRFGKEIVQLYVSDKTGAARRPLAELKGYEKVALQPRETKTVTMTIDYRSLAWYSTNLHDWYAASGDYEILVGASSRDIRQSASLHLENSTLLPLHVTRNTTLGELMADARTAPLIGEWVKKMLAVFAAPEDTEDEARTAGSKDARATDAAASKAVGATDAVDPQDAAADTDNAKETSASEEAVSEEMNNAMMVSMPLRNLVTFGTCNPVQLDALIEELNQL
ncbi:MAG: glycoside hydrolase family 3 C-terminal domain-containing protein [Lachnospiraceae bacterium]|nr:glycoside hydrolase family 3 C-terminal domain-containing protein [Lachnospiraceae bacterium]